MLSGKISTCKEKGKSFYLIIFDIDDFKTFNETYGHRLGDEVIHAVAQGVKNNMRKNDYIGRYGGDEFMILIDHATREEFFARVSRIQQALCNIKVRHADKEIPVSVSFGAVQYLPDRSTDVEALLQAADKAMFHVKRSGGGQIYLAE